jgi:S1-C subfamily serine protease
MKADSTLDRDVMKRTRADGRRHRRVGTAATALALAALVTAVTVQVGLAASRATKAVGNGIVVVDTTLGYEGGEAAGTGIVLTSNGTVLTNNHVIQGATAIRVAVPGTGKTYSARVTGYSVGTDVAVLRVANATNLATVTAASGARLRVGQRVSATGNARGTGNLSTVTGTITGLSRTITASDGEGQSERLTGLIETNAPAVAGDSGGPLRDARGRVIGMVTAASSSGDFRFRNAPTSRSYAIPIGKALSVVRTVGAGTTTATVHVGPTAFLGVSIAVARPAGGDGSGTGAVVAGVATGSPAARVGLEPGDVIVRVDGKTVTSPSVLRARVLRKRPGQKLTLVYRDAYGSSTTVTVTLASGPPQ